MRVDKNQKKMSIAALILNYGAVLAVFLAAFFLPDYIDIAGTPLLAMAWIMFPVIFFVGYIIITKRTMESLVLACLLLAVFLYRDGFVLGFYDSLLETVSVKSTMNIVFMLLLMGGMVRLLSNCGGINALKRISKRRLKTKVGTLLAAYLCIIILFIDDYLSTLISGICFVPVMDKRRLPREMPGIMMGLLPGAVCPLVPFSVVGAFVTGLLVVTIGNDGAAVFLQSLPYNFVSILTLLVVFVLAMGKLPSVGVLKKAEKRVARGGALWPPGSDQFEDEANVKIRGNVLNLFLPIVILIASSIVSGTLIQGTFSVDIIFGLLVTLFVMFILYCFQRLMTPEEFFDNIISGVEHSVVPIILLVLTFCFSGGIKQIGLIEWLSGAIPYVIGENYFILPAFIFAVFTAITIVWGSSWSIFAIGLPIAVQLALAVGGNPALYAGAVCAAGIAGDALSIHQSDNHDVATIVGCEPTALFLARVPYFIFIVMVSFILFLFAGVLF
jgi:Na+/H+ antiporter NhaC